MTDVSKLISRLERADEGSRSLGNEVASALGFGPFEHLNPTLSVDVPMEMVPEDWVIVSLTNGTVDPSYGEVRGGKWRAALAPRSQSVLGDATMTTSWPTGVGAKAPLALCIAILRSLELSRNPPGS